MNSRVFEFYTILNAQGEAGAGKGRFWWQREAFILLLAYSFHLLPLIILELYIRYGLFKCFSRAMSVLIQQSVKVTKRVTPRK